MNNMIERLPILVACGIVLGIAPTPVAWATRVSAQAVAGCQPALPAFEGVFRKRPLAIQNEGTTDAFVTCALRNPLPDGSFHGITHAWLYLQNFSNTHRGISCTAVNSSAIGSPGQALYLTKSAFVPISSTSNAPMWFPATGFPGAPASLPGDTLSVSCMLPPGFGISSTLLINDAP